MNNKISELIITEGVEFIGKYAFNNNKMKTSTYQRVWKSIEFGTLKNQISNLTLPDGIESIGEDAFKSNTLTEVYLPESIYGFVDKAFDPDVKIKKKSFFNKIFW